MLKDEMICSLIEAAKDARKNSYSPYSNFAVGAAVLAKNGMIYTGCNIENAAYGPTNCAERTAIFKAVSEGIQAFDAIAIVGSPKGEKITQYAYPCGVCRQVMMEFCDPESFEIFIAKSNLDYQRTTLDKLLPEGFGKANLDKNERRVD